MNYGVNNQGYGVIKWTQNSDALEGLVVQGYGFSMRSFPLGEETRISIPVNNGLPF